jgi:hypothetical protein
MLTALADNNAISWVKNKEVVVHECIIKKPQSQKKKHNKDNAESRERESMPESRTKRAYAA